MNKLILVFVLTICFNQIVFGQEEINEDSTIESKEKELRLDFQNVSQLDFEIVTQDKSDEFDAVYLINQEHIYFYQYGDFFQNRTVFRRIRIENEEGLRYATHSINLYNVEGSAKEDVEMINGFTYNLVNGKIKKTPLKKDAIFSEDVNEYYKVVSFTMPDVRVGSVLEFSYKIGSNTVLIDDLNLQYEVPVLVSDINVDFPKRGLYNVVFNPRASYRLSFNPEDFGDKVSNLTISANDDVLGKNVEIQKLQISNDNIVLTTQNIPALKPEPLSGGINKYRAKIMMNLAAVLDYEGEVDDKVASTWEDVTKTIYNNDNFGKAIKKAGFYKSDLENAVKNITNPTEKIETIFNLVKSKIKWNGKYGLYSSDGLKGAYKTGSGRVGDVNLLLVSMLQKAGIEAYPVLVSSDKNDIPVFPTALGFDYVIAHAVVDGKGILLDATEEYARPGFIPLRAANWKGRLIRKDGSSEWVNLFENQESQEVVMLNVAFDEDGFVKGSVKKRLSNYMALNSRNNNLNATDEELEEYLQNDNVGLVVQDVKVDGMKSDDKHINYDFNIEYKNAIDQIGNKFYVTPLLYEANEESPFKLETRELPLDLSFPIETKTIVNITIPDGYEVESVPQSVKKIYNEGKGSYKYVTKVSGNKIYTVATFKLNTSVVLPADYESFKDFFESIVEKDAEKIVLKKI